MTLLSITTDNFQVVESGPLRGLQQDGAFRYEFPTFRYQVWDAKDVAAQTEAGALQYNADSWNYVTFNEVENLCYETLQGESVTEAASTIGFTEEVWDCFINHYVDYDWSDLVDEGVDGYMTDLGWTEETWAADDAPESDDFYWDQLSFRERRAAHALCYFEETWNGELSMDQWPALPVSP